MRHHRRCHQPNKSGGIVDIRLQPVTTTNIVSAIHDHDADRVRVMFNNVTIAFALCVVGRVVRYVVTR